MKVQIENNLYLESDGMQFIIKEYTGKNYENKETGKVTESYNTHGYYTNVQSAIKSLIKKKVMESTAMDLKSLLESVEGIKQYIEEKVAV